MRRRAFRRAGPWIRLRPGEHAEAHGIVRRLLLALARAFVVLGADRSPATADSSPANPQQRLEVIQQIRAQLGSNLADALAAQQQLRQSLVENAAQQQQLQSKIADLQAQISDLDTQISIAQQRE